MAISQTLPNNSRRSHGVVRIQKEPSKRVRMVSAFQLDYVKYVKDPQLRALWQARNATFKLGEPVDVLTTLIKARMAELKGLTPTI